MLNFEKVCKKCARKMILNNLHEDQKRQNPSKYWGSYL